MCDALIKYNARNTFYREMWLCYITLLGSIRYFGDIAFSIMLRIYFVNMLHGYVGFLLSILYKIPIQLEYLLG